MPSIFFPVFVFQQLISYVASFKSTVLIKKEARKTLLNIHNSIKLMWFK